MPRRVSYQQHRASLASARNPAHIRFRHGSVAESETDLESIFSSTTYQSHGSSPYTRQALLLDPTGLSTVDSPYTRASPALSSRRAYSSSPGPKNRNPRRSSNLGPRPIVEAENSPDVSALGLRLSAEDVPSTKDLTPLSVSDRAAAGNSIPRNEKRRRVIAERSTLTGGAYESPLRLWIRWMTWQGWEAWTLCVGQVGTVLVTLIAGHLSGRFRYLKPGDWIMEIVRVLGWWAMVWSWARDEGQRGGRSLRTQITSILTIILAPSILPGNHLLALTGTVASLRLLSSGNDLPAAAIALSTCILSAKTWPYALSIWGYLVGKAVWMGGRQQIRLFLGSLLVVSPLLAACTCSARERVSDLIDVLLNSLFSAPELLSSRYLVPFMEVLPLRQCIAYSDGQYTWRSVLRTIETYIAGHKLLLPGTTLGALSPLTVLLYSSYSFQPLHQSNTQKLSPRRPPMHNLILQTMFIISSSSSVFLGSRQDVVLPLFPLLLMMSLRGGSARGSEGLSVGWDVWSAGAWATCLGAVMAAGNTRDLLVSLGTAIFWSTLIGAPSHLVLATFLGTFMQYASTVFPSIAIAPDAVFRLATVAGWVWGMKKMVESAWAVGGLSGRRSTAEKKGHEVKGLNDCL
ncbi:hypothetical protein IAR50_000455 [Cryptococcus sp. DSM 104548]